MIDWTRLTLFLFILARMSGFILFNPILGRRTIPGIFRAGMVLVFTVFVAATAEQATVRMPVGTADLVLRLVLELGVGFLLGMAVNFFFVIPQVAGTMIDTQMGMTMSQIYDAGSQANMSVTGTLLNALMTLLFFAANGHHTLVRLFLTSGEIVAFGEASLGTQALNAAVELFIEAVMLGIKLCMPILAAEIISQVGMGILMKVIPQINVFSINIELKVMIGLGMLFVLIAPFSEFLLKAEMQMLDSLRNLLVLTGV